MSRYRILIKSIDAMDATPELVELTTDEAEVFAHEGGLTIRTEPTATGGYYNERIVPWGQLLDYRKTRDSG